MRKEEAERTATLQRELELSRKEVATEKKKRTDAEKNAAMSAAVVASTPRGGIENAMNESQRMDGRQVGC